jgi:Xaa-Pro dipeptidase
MYKELNFNAELSTRRKNVRALMSNRDLDALVIYSHTGYACNVQYLTSYIPTLGDALMIIWPDRPGTLLTAFDYDVPRARKVSRIDDVRTTQGGMVNLEDILQEGNFPTTGRLGVVGFKTLPMAQYKRVEQKWPDVEWVDASQDFEHLRLHKSDYEIEMLRRAAEISITAIKALAAASRKGITELELAAIADMAARRAGAEKMVAPTTVMTGPDITPPSARPTERKLEEGDTIMVDLGGVYQGYCGDISRVMVVGKPTSQQFRAHKTVLEAYRRGLSLVKPGTLMKSIHNTVNDHLIKMGYGPMIHRVGHGLGLETSLEAPDLMRDEGVLEQGMVFSFEPGIYPKGVGAFRIEDMVVVTKNGYEILGNYPLDLQSV